MRMTKRKEKDAKKCITRRKTKFEYYKHCSEATQLENKINQPEKNKFDMVSLRVNHKEFIENNKLILKSQQIFRSEKHNVFTEEVNKIPFSANDDKRIQLIHSTETAYRSSKDLLKK